MPYHHGQLRAALVDAAVELARAGGPDSVALRPATRAAGVSHNAAYRHFADRDELLWAVCERCMSALAALMEQRVADVPATGVPFDDAWARLYATGRAYIDFALAEPGWFRTAFAVPRTLDYFLTGEGAGPEGLSPHQLLSARLDELAAAGGLADGRREGAEYAAWAAVHGVSSLLIDGPLRELGADEREAAIEKVLAMVDGGI